MPSLKAIQEEIRSTYERRTKRSRQLHERAVRSLPRGETRSITYYAPYPTFIEQEQGCHVVDADGNEYLDLLNNYTALVHGHAHPEITAAISEQSAKMTVNCSPHELQFVLAEEMVRRVPSVERVCFANSGTEAVLNAIRLARVHSRRIKILKMEGGYHGMMDAVCVSLDPGSSAPAWPRGVLNGPGISSRILDEVLVAPFNDLETTAGLIRQHRDELAAVIVEPVMGAAGVIPADAAFLCGLQQVCHECGVLLICDEIITFRVASGGAQSLYGIRPDLTTFGKVMGGGLPVGAFGGRADLMELCDPCHPDTFFHSGTFTGNLVTMAAGITALKLLDDRAIEGINQLGDSLRARLKQVFADAGIGGTITGTGSLAQVHLCDRSVRDYRSAICSRDKVRPWLHLSLMNHGIFAASRGLYSLSTPMGKNEIDRGVVAFGEAVEQTKALLLDWEHVESLPRPLEYGEATSHPN